MKKLVLLVAILAVLAVAAISAMAQVGEEFEREIGDTGSVELLVEVSGAGDNSDQGVVPVQVANTDNAQGFIQYASTAGDAEFEDNSLEFGPAWRRSASRHKEWQEESLEQTAKAFRTSGHVHTSGWQKSYFWMRIVTSGSGYDSGVGYKRLEAVTREGGRLTVR